jgi:hypothetical protein
MPSQSSRSSRGRWSSDMHRQLAEIRSGVDQLYLNETGSLPPRPPTPEYLRRSFRYSGDSRRDSRLSRSPARGSTSGWGTSRYDTNYAFPSSSYGATSSALRYPTASSSGYARPSYYSQEPSSWAARGADTTARPLDLELPPYKDEEERFSSTYGRNFRRAVLGLPPTDRHREDRLPSEGRAFRRTILGLPPSDRLADNQYSPSDSREFRRTVLGLPHSGRYVDRY